MSNVVDLFSRKPVQLIAERNHVDDEWVDENGKYIGVLANRDRDSLRSFIDQLALLDEQNEKIEALRHETYDRYLHHLTRSLTYLELHTPKDNKVDVDKDDVYIDEKGHVWVVYNGNSEDGRPT